MDIIDTTYDVLVAGAGPAGLTTAIGLARHGVRTLVVERHAGTSPFPKATGVSTRTMEILRTWGLEEQVREGAISVQVGVAVSTALASPPLRIVSFGYPEAQTALAVSPTTPITCPQDHLEPVLLEHLRARGGHVCFGTELTRLHQDGDGVIAQLFDRASGTASRVRTRYLVVRAGLGVDLEQLGSLGDHVTVYFRADLSGVAPQPRVVHAIEAEDASGLLVRSGETDGGSTRGSATGT